MKQTQDPRRGENNVQIDATVVQAASSARWGVGGFVASSKVLCGVGEDCGLENCVQLPVTCYYTSQEGDPELRDAST